MRITIFLVGLTLFFTGVAYTFWPAVLIFAGLLLAFVAVRMSDVSKAPVRAVYKPDLNNN